MLFIIGFHTEILRRNRARIMDAIVEFVGTDLLNTKNIMETVRDENTAQLLIDYFEQNKEALEVLIFKGRKVISVSRELSESKLFYGLFMKKYFK